MRAIMLAMHRLRSTSACLLASTLALAACSAETRNFGGAGGETTTQTTTGSSTGGTGGSGGTGTTTTSTTGTGGSVPASCTPSGGFFDILNANDFGTDEIDDKPLLVPGTADGRGQVHVLVRNRTSGTAVIRTIIDDPSPLGNTVNLFLPDGTSFDYAAGWVDTKGLHVAGVSGNVGLGQVDYPLTGSGGVGDVNSFNTYQTPSKCQGGGQSHIKDVRMSVVNGEVVYLMVCETPTAPPDQALMLFTGGSNAPPTQLATGGDTEIRMHPSLITTVNGKLLAFFSDDFGPVGVSYGTPSQIANPIPFSFSAAAGVVSVAFGLTPLPSGDGVALFGANVDQNLTQGTLWSGALGPNELGGLGQTPPAGMNKILTAPDVTKFGGLSNPTYDANSIVTAGASIVLDAVYLSWFTRDAKPIVLEQQIVKSNGSNTIIAGAAAPLGQLLKLVVWIERDASSPPHYTVRGQKMLCKPGS
jgi:hypothetical protein